MSCPRHCLKGRACQENPIPLAKTLKDCIPKPISHQVGIVKIKTLTLADPCLSKEKCVKRRNAEAKYLEASVLAPSLGLVHQLLMANRGMVFVTPFNSADVCPAAVA